MEIQIQDVHPLENKGCQNYDPLTAIAGLDLADVELAIVEVENVLSMAVRRT